LQDFDHYTRWLHRLEKRRFPADDVFLLCVRRMKRSLAALDSVSKVAIGQRKASQIFVDRDKPRRA
jgi:hypothetical protein